MEVVLWIVDVHDVDAIPPEATQAGVELPSRRVATEVELDVAASGTVDEGPADLGRDHDVTDTGERHTEPFLRLAEPVERGGVEQTDAGHDGALRRGDGGAGVVAPEHRRQRGGAEREWPDVDAGATERPPRANPA